MPKIQLLVTCLIDTLAPGLGDAVVEVLEKAGCRIEVPRGQTCCGQPAFNGGFWDEARSMAKHTIEVLGHDDAPVVIPSGSCADMVVNHYPELFADDPVWLPRAEALARRTFEFTQYLVDVLAVTDLGARCEGKLAYHASCHLLSGMKVHRQPLELLSRVADADVVPLAEEQECCGFGGLFSIKYPGISAAMLERKLRNVFASGARYVVGCDYSCLLNMNARLHRLGRLATAGERPVEEPVTSHQSPVPLVRAVHIAEVLAGKAG